MRTAALVTSLAVLVTGALAKAGELPWVAAGDLPIAPDARSVAIVEDDEPIYSRPAKDSPRRGAAIGGSRLPLYGTAKGPGCAGRWLNVGPSAWVCQDRARVTRHPPLTASLEPDVFESGMPLDYYFVGKNGTFGYAKLSLAEEGIPDAELQPGFAVAVVQVANKAPGDPFGLTTKGLWLPMRDLGAVRAPALTGVGLVAGTQEPAWVITDRASVYEKPAGRRIPGEHSARRTRLDVHETTEKYGRGWVRVGNGRWMRRKDLRLWTPAESPKEALENERWIDVDLENQVLTAYEGTKPVFATLVSTGKGRGDSELATPKGVHRIWVKLVTSDMTNLEDEEARRYYAIEEVPWVMFFKEGYGLHGAFWHRSFGRVRSHGCVNLAPRDAQRIFHWAGPRLPAGWRAVLPTEYDPGAIVRVR